MTRMLIGGLLQAFCKQPGSHLKPKLSGLPVKPFELPCPKAMIRIAPMEKDTDHAALDKLLLDAADQFRANRGLKSQEYSAPVLGLIFLRFAEVRFASQRAKLEKASASARRGSRVDEHGALNVNVVDKERLKDMVGPGRRFPFGLLRTD